MSIIQINDKKIRIFIVITFWQLTDWTYQIEHVHAYNFVSYSQPDGYKMIDYQVS